MSFDKRASSWDKENRRVQNAKAIARAIKERIDLNKNMHIVDFGVGTGLLGYFLSDKVAKISGVDNSKNMLKEFLAKKNKFNCEIEAIEADFNNDSLKFSFDGIISSMTIHHIKDIKALFEKFYNMLNRDGFIALADLVKEDGTFHSDNSGVYHFGFEKDEIVKIAKEAGFSDVKFDIINKIKKPHKEFEVFLLSGKK